MEHIVALWVPGGHLSGRQDVISRFEGCFSTLLIWRTFCWDKIPEQWGPEFCKWNKGQHDCVRPCFLTNVILNVLEWMSYLLHWSEETVETCKVVPEADQETYLWVSTIFVQRLRSMSLHCIISVSLYPPLAANASDLQTLVDPWNI